MHMLAKSMTTLLLTVILMSTASAAENDGTLATVNGEPIKRSDLLIFAQLRNPQADLSNPQILQQLIKAYVGRELLYQEALAQKLDEDERVQIALKNQRHELISQALTAQYLQENPVTEEQVRALYEREAAKPRPAEYKVAHILTQTEDAAQRVIERLNSGEEFGRVARNFSTDSSAVRDGELGWVNPSRMPPPFAEAIKQTPVGEYTKSPVRTDHGWHVVKTLASRPMSMPAYDQVRERLRQMLVEQRVTEYIVELQKKANIEIMK